MSRIARLMQQAAAGAGGLDIADAFSTDLYTGNGTSQMITTGIDLVGEGGLVWSKRRNLTGGHYLHDTERGRSYFLSSDTTSAENGPNLDLITSFNSDGYSLGSSIGINGSFSYVSWTFRQAPKFFDVVTYTGDGVAGRTISHNLGIAPGMIVVKNRGSTSNWIANHRTQSVSDVLLLNTTSSEFFDPLITGRTDTEITLSGGSLNNNGSTYVMYLFAHDTAADGVIQCGSYTGNGSSTGPVVSLGWEPQWLLVKRSDSTGDWWMYDNARDTTNPRTNKLLANSSAAEDTAGEDLDFTSTGFQPKTTATGINASGGTYVYVAIRAEGV